MVRQRPIVLSSDDDEIPLPREDVEPPTQQSGAARKLMPKKSTLPAPPARSKGISHDQEESRTKVTTPKKPSRSKRVDPLTASNPRTLNSFFNAATQRAQNASIKAASPEVGDSVLEDIDDLSDVVVQDHRESTPNKPDNGFLRKRLWTDTRAQEKSEGTRAVSNKFLKTIDGQRAPTPQSHKQQPIQQDSQPWTERFAPQNLDELGVHPKKVADVRSWLQRVMSGQQYQKLLVLRGPAGSGKTATVFLLSQALGYAVIEWENPEQSLYDSDDFVSATSRLADFMSRAGQFGGLEMVKTGRSEQTPKVEESTSEAQVMLMEEFPSIAGSSFTTTAAFREQLLQYLAMSVRSSNAQDSASRRPIVPLILIISESVMSDNNSADNFTAHRLLGSDILQHPGVTVIDFNPVAPTILSKALKLVMQKQARASHPVQNISSTVMQRLSEVGDIRNAVSTLDYVCNVPSAPDARSQPVPVKATSKKAKGVKSKPAKVMEQEEDNATLSLVAMRQTTLGLFHAVGKVVYNKRSDESTPQPNGTSAITAREKPAPDLDVDALLSTTGTDTSIFLSALHENYLLSCFDQYGDNEATLDSVEGCIDALGDADLLGSCGGKDRGRTMTSYAAAAEGMRQSELSFHVGVLGLQHALPHPVKRQAASQRDDRPNIAHRGGKGDAHRMFYPMDLKLWRHRDDFQGSIDFLVERALDGRLTAAMPFDARNNSSMSSDYRSQERTIIQPGRVGATIGSAKQPEDEIAVDQSAVYTIIASGLSARKLMLLERLPYLRHIAAARSMSSMEDSLSLLREVDKITSFTGISVRRDEESDDEVETAPLPTFSRKNKVVDGAVSDGLEKLELSDDNIIDD